MVEAILEHAWLDEHGMLQLEEGALGELRAPHDPFWQDLAREIQETYGYTGFPEDEKGKKLHQLRMYIDRNHIFYIRKKFGKYSDQVESAKRTDEEALRAYVQEELAGEKLLREPARFHNRYPKKTGESYRTAVAGRENKKRLTPDFHGEFILDPQGWFVSQWNVLVTDEKGHIISDVSYYQKKQDFLTSDGKQADWTWASAQIANTESFNYANRNDLMHARLDIWPPEQMDSELRMTARKQWLTPSKKKRLFGSGKNVFDYSSDVGDDYSRS